MGTWGAGIYDDDTALDVRQDFLEELKKGTAVGQIERMIDDDYVQDDPDDDPVVILALACVELETATLTDKIKTAALQVISSGAGMERWEEDGQDELTASRKRELNLIKKYLTNYSGKPLKRKVWSHLGLAVDVAINAPLPSAEEEKDAKLSLKQYLAVHPNVTIFIGMAIMLVPAYILVWLILKNL